MAKNRKLTRFLLCLLMCMPLSLHFSKNVEAKEYDNCLNDLTGGVAVILEANSSDAKEVIYETAKALNLSLNFDKEQTKLVMAKVKNVLNVRKEPQEDSEKIGKLYKDCGGTILERKDGWTKLQSGNIVGWAKDEYLYFGEEAREVANSVGKMIATINTETLRVRTEPSGEASVYGLLPQGEIVEVIDNSNEDWICIDYDGLDGYVSAEYVLVDFKIDAGETMDEIKAREAAEEEAKRHVNYGEYTTDADTTLLLAALIHCEAGGESYEGQVAVGAVVMNRVRSGAYPNSIHGVIYASGQFTPAMSGKVNRVLESGKIYESCITAAEEALSGVSNVGDRTHFRRNNGTRDGLVIGNHVFF